MGLMRSYVNSVLSRADVEINGDRPWDIQVDDDSFYRDLVFNGSLGLGESYMQGDWRCEDMEELFCRLVSNGLENSSKRIPVHALSRLRDRFVNQQTRNKALANIHHHYNLGNDLFFEFLGGYKNYSCGYYKNATTLEEAQVAKMERLCELLELNENDRLLDVGGGWGEFANFAARSTGCHVTSVNISDEQIKAAREKCEGANVDIIKSDYRDVQGSFNKIAVIAMFTHVGPQNYRSFMQTMDGLLEPGGKMLMETVGGIREKESCEPWTNKYIFPGGVIPTLGQVDEAIDGIFTRTGVDEFGEYYVLTLREWHKNFMAAWPRLKEKYSESMRLMFEYFFLSVAGAFRAGELLHYHIEFAKAAADDGS